MEGTSLTPQQEKLKALKEILPEAFAEGKIDWEKLKATLGEDINFSNERYVLNWAGKSDAFKVLQTPTTKTLIPCPEESVKADGTPYKKGETFFTDANSPLGGEGANLFIEGENLEVLKVLQKSYFGKVKMIYIDPPYNTGNDSFIYPDKFSETKAEYEKRVGDKDEEGYRTKDSIFHPSFGGDGGGFKKNSKENGQYHSNWLNMMMPRLYLAKNLLRTDGVIFVSIDDNEVHNLRLLMNEIFGEENFVNLFTWKKNSSGKTVTKQFPTNIEYVFMYAKNINSLTFNVVYKPLSQSTIDSYSKDDKDGRGKYCTVSLQKTGSPGPETTYDYIDNDEKIWKCPAKGWRMVKSKVKELEIQDRLYKEGETLREKRYWDERANEGQLADTLWDDLDEGNIGTSEVKKIFESIIFDYPKPLDLLNRAIKIGSNPNDLILDFFAGSGTTAHAVMELNKEDGGNRKYICVQLPELCDEKSEAYKAGYQTIAEISKERIRRAGKKIQAEVNQEITNLEVRIAKLKTEIQTEETIKEIADLQTKIGALATSSGLGFKVLKLADSNFKQWQQIEGKDAKALTEQMQLFIDPVAENATIENMVYEFLLKSGKDLNSKISLPNPSEEGAFHIINDGELILILEVVNEQIIEKVIAKKPIKVIALDKLFANNDQLKTNTVLQMRDAGIEFKTV